jgi:iron complex outermembrane receptor protein
MGVRAQFREITTGGSLKTPSTFDLSLAGFLVEELGTGPIRLQVGARYDWARYTPREQTTITVGGEEVPVRERTFGSVSGALGALFAPREDVRLGASLSRAYRTPDFNELYADGPHLAANSYDVGDPELRQETGIGADIFARFTGEQLRVEVAAFRNELSDYIFPSSRGRVERGPQRGRPRLQYTNHDARFTGLEGDLEVSVLRRWVIHGTASAVHAEFLGQRDRIPVFEGVDTIFVDASRYPPLIPPLHGSAGLRYDMPGRFAGAVYRWASAQERLGDFEDRTAGYGALDLNAGVRFLWHDRLHAITLRLENALDTEYRDHLSRVKSIMPEPGRNLSLLYRLIF